MLLKGNSGGLGGGDTRYTQTEMWERGLRWYPSARLACEVRREEREETPFAFSPFFTQGSVGFPSPEK